MPANWNLVSIGTTSNLVQSKTYVRGNGDSLGAVILLERERGLKGVVRGGVGVASGQGLVKLVSLMPVTPAS